MMKADAVQKEVDTPPDGQCDSGHRVDFLFRRGGPNSPEEPVRFFHLSGPEIKSGTYCEPCLILMHKIRKGIRDGHIPRSDGTYKKDVDIEALIRNNVKRNKKK